MGRMKGLDDFVWVLAIALVLVVIFMGVAAVVPFNPAIPANLTNNTPGTNVLASFSQVGPVGYSSSYAGQSVSYGSFAVGQTQADNVKRATQLDICAGLWCNRQQTFAVDVPSYYLDTLKDVRISFAVYDTNQYGDIVVKWNGKEMQRGRSSRDQTIIITKDNVKDSNTLQIFADGPGLMFWASTVYTLRDFRVDIEYGPAHISTFTLSQQELNAWNSGDLSFFGSSAGSGLAADAAGSGLAAGAAGNSGQMRIRSNGYVVYQGTPSGQVDVPLNFSNAVPKVGENLLVFDALNNGVFNLNNVQFKLYLMTNQINKNKAFTISASDYSRLGQGKITFTVNSVQKDGDMSMKLNGKSLNVPRLSVGTNIVYFTRAEAAQGTNTLDLTGTGYWDIGDMTITI